MVDEKSGIVEKKRARVKINKKGGSDKQIVRNKQMKLLCFILQIYLIWILLTH